jgi:hypothetical protein
VGAITAPTLLVLELPEALAVEALATVTAVVVVADTPVAVKVAAAEAPTTVGPTSPPMEHTTDTAMSSSRKYRFLSYQCD